jgi:hypothetical protein
LNSNGLICGAATDASKYAPSYLGTREPMPTIDAEPTESVENKPLTAEDSALPEGEESLVAVQEIGGPSGPEPTRFGDWERKGRCVDF